MPKVASINLVYTLSDEAFEAGLRKVLARRPDLVALQEAGRNRDRILERVSKAMGYEWCRPVSPNGDPTMPVMWRNCYRVRSCRPVRLARREFVGHLPGRKSRLPASWATEVILDELGTSRQTALINFHMTAEVQFGAGYRKDRGHRLRVNRHRRERWRLGRRARWNKRRGRRTFAAGDGNYDGIKLRGFVNCWMGRSGGTLDHRAVDVVFAATRGKHLSTIETPSDHDALVVDY